MGLCWLSRCLRPWEVSTVGLAVLRLIRSCLAPTHRLESDLNKVLFDCRKAGGVGHFQLNRNQIMRENKIKYSNFFCHLLL